MSRVDAGSPARCVGDENGMPAAPAVREALERLAAWTDPREVVSMTESLRLGRARVDHVSADGVLLYLPSSQNYLHAAVDDAGARRVLAGAARELGDSVVLFADADHAVACGYAEESITRYRVCVYEGAEPPSVRGGRFASSAWA